MAEAGVLSSSSSSSTRPSLATWRFLRSAMSDKDLVKKVRRDSRPAPIVPHRLEGFISHGSIIFAEAGAKAEANFSVISESIDLQSISNLFEAGQDAGTQTLGWGLKRPQVLLSVTGSAQEMHIEPALEMAVKHGLSSAARSSEAWVFTGGMDTGVMAMTGTAMRAMGTREDTTGLDRTPCIGIVPFRKITHREKLIFASRTRSDDREALYVKRTPNSDESAGLDPNHTHFICVDNQNDAGWGGEVELRGKLEKHLAERFDIPTVLVVVKGGPVTYRNVAAAVEADKRIVLVKESHGAAELICEYIQPLMGDDHGQHFLSVDDATRKERLEERDTAIEDRLQKCVQRKELKKEQLGMVRENLHMFASRLELFTIYSKYEETRFDVAILKAIISSYKVSKLNEEVEMIKKQRATRLDPLYWAPRPHERARAPHPGYPDRFPVPDHKVDWGAPWFEYNPTPYTDPKVNQNTRDKLKYERVGHGWADPDLPMREEDRDDDDPLATMTLPFDATFVEELKLRKSFEREDSMRGIQFDELNRPLNPRGRTGMSGRGLLGKWGPNHTADPIVTRYDPQRPHMLQMVAIQRKDTHEWAIPGGMVDDKETVSATVRREFEQEAVNGERMTGEQVERNRQLLDELFASGKVVYQGYVDDPRVTDNAWIETTAFHYHCDKDCAQMLRLESGDDAKNVTWIDVDASSPKYMGLYASHKDWVDMVAQYMRSHVHARSTELSSRLFAYPPRHEVPNGKVSWNDEWEEYSPPTADVSKPPVKALKRSSTKTNLSKPSMGSRLRNVERRRRLSVGEVGALAEDAIRMSEPGEERGISSPRATERPEVAKRLSYESPVTFESEDRRMPRNPRGRTGLRGRGVLPEPGPNHRIEAIITRFHPRGEAVTRSAGKDGRKKAFRRVAHELLRKARGASPSRKAAPSNQEARSFARLGTPSRRQKQANAPTCVSPTAAPSDAAARGNSTATTPGMATTATATGSEAKALLSSVQVLAFPVEVPIRRHMDKDKVTGEAIEVVDKQLVFCVVPPDYYDDPAADKISKFVQKELMDEAKRGREHERETRERLEYLLQDFFSGAGSHEIYCGYADDPRNTDNAWVESTVRLHHMSRELGGQLYFANDEGNGARWVALDDERLQLTQHEWLETAYSILRHEYGSPGLLQMVVRWGRTDMVQMVLQDEHFRDQRQPKHVQRSFQDALERSMEPSFDVSLVQTLLEHGAEAAGVCMPRLFTSVQHESFGFCKDLRDGKFKSSRKTRKRMEGQTALRLPSWLRPSQVLGKDSRVLAMLRSTFSSSYGDEDHLQRTPDGIITPWEPDQVQLIASLGLHGFEDYARRQPVVRYLDLMIWSIVVGALEEARLMWQKTSSPLRAGLIAQAMCQQIKHQKHMREKDLDDATRKFSDDLVGVLDHLPDDEEARKMLTAKHDAFATIGRRNSKMCDILELAIDLENKEFIAHSRCQKVLDQQWRGRAARCGLVQLGRPGWNCRFGEWFELNDLHGRVALAGNK